MTFLKSYRFWIGITVSLLLLWLAIKDIPFQTLANSFSRAAYLWIVPAIIAQLLAVLTRCQRWIVLLKQPQRLVSSIWAQSIGYLFTNVLPFRMGEPARVLVMAEQCDLPVMYVTGTAVVERLFDVATIILALVFILPWMQVPESVSNSGLVFGLIVVIGLITIILMARFKQKAHQLLEWIIKMIKFLPTQSVLRWWDDLIDSLSILLDWKIAASTVFWSIITWFFSACTYIFVIKAFQPDGLVIEAVFMLVALSLAVTLPSSPGFIGVYQFAGQQALVLPFGAKYNSANALSITLTAHMNYYLITTGLGLIAIWVTGLSFSKILKSMSNRNKSDVQQDIHSLSEDHS